MMSEEFNIPTTPLVVGVCSKEGGGKHAGGQMVAEVVTSGVLTFTSCLAEIPRFLPVLNDADETMPGRQEGDGNGNGPLWPRGKRGVARAIAGGNEWLLYLPAADYVGTAMTRGYLMSMVMVEIVHTSLALTAAVLVHYRQARHVSLGP